MKKITKLLILSSILLTPFNTLAYSNYIIPGGENIGIKINSNGILIIGFYEINGKYNQNNLKIGDYITKVNNLDVNTIDELVSYINKYVDNNKVNITIKRKNKEKNITLDLYNENNVYKTGLFVKDSLSGIGTLTYIDPTTNIYGALGHEIIESNSNIKLDIKDGKIFESIVTGIDRSKNGIPGTKNARLLTENTYGTITENTKYGIFGKITNKFDKNVMEVGNFDELKLGEAIIYTVLDKNEIKEYKINITKIDKNSDSKNIYFDIIDYELLEETGGIVQGMSGSPIIQDNKIYGAVTHVIVDNVKSGFGINIHKMLYEGEN